LHALGYGYVDTVAYWIREGSPDRMDADRNDIPCETVYPHARVVAFWGDPLPTTTAARQRYVVNEPTYKPESLPGAGGYFGSGCSPGAASLPDGVWYGSIESATPSAVAFDLKCFAPTPPGEDGFRISNASSTLRTVSVASSAMVNAIAPDGFWMLRPYAEWHLDPGGEGFCLPGGCWTVWLYVNGGEVTEIVQLWFT
jgi:hypothetical protein